MLEETHIIIEEVQNDKNKLMSLVKQTNSTISKKNQDTAKIGKENNQIRNRRVSANTESYTYHETNYRMAVL